MFSFLQSAAPAARRAVATTASVTRQLNTTDIVKLVATNHDLSQAEARRVFDTILDSISEVRCIATTTVVVVVVAVVVHIVRTHLLTYYFQSVAKHETVSISKFGSFASRKAAARKGRNPQTGEVG